MHFGVRLLKQVLFGDKFITEHEGAYEGRGEIIKTHQQAEQDHILENDPRYKPNNEIKEEGLQ